MTELFLALTVLLLLSGAPLFAILLAAAFTGFAWAEIPLTIVAVELTRLTDTPLLVSLPLFAFAGYALAEGRSADRLVALTQAALGGLRGGVAWVTVLCCALFTAFTGASGVTLVALGALLYPALRADGFSDRSALGLVTTSGSLGLLLVPSVPLILYGVLAQQLGVGPSFSLRQLFLAGVVPLLVMMLALGAVALFQLRRDPRDGQEGAAPEAPPAPRPKLREALWAARFEAPLPVIVLGGIYGGVFALSEVAAVTALYVVLAQCLLYRDVSLRALPSLAWRSMTLVGGVLMILAAALALANVFVDAQLPERLFEAVSAQLTSKTSFLLALNLGLLLLGMIIDSYAAIVLLVPLLLPVAVAYEIHPIHFGMIFLANLQLGTLTPPVGMNLFIASVRFKQPLGVLYRASLPYLGALLFALLLITYIPVLSTFTL
ncbi:MAG: TRAP transporter large permease subunit [Pseudomonadales bacterium]|nr:TRAP transporter large permease subunit [Pseudomonadales bacterium]